jgi:hypothetical protein
VRCTPTIFTFDPLGRISEIQTLPDVGTGRS